MTATAEHLASVAAAQSIVLEGLAPTPVERLTLDEACGLVLAADVVAGHALPGCDNSAMDGYAVVADDCTGATPLAPAVLPVSGEARAGREPARLVPGTAMLISTGAPVPEGADAVVRVEDTRPAGAGVAILVAVRSGEAIRRAGEDAARGELMVPAGRRLRPVDVAACAAAGAATVAVHRRPRVAVIGGGDELVPVGTAPAPHQVVDSNAAMLAAAIRDAGGDPVQLGSAADDASAVGNLLDEASRCDLVISTAGVSVGDHDHVRAAVENLGRILLWRVAMRPGKPVLVGDVRGTRVLGLPGNPVSSAVAFVVFARPAILALQGATDPLPRRIAVRLAEEVTTPAALETYVRVRLEAGDDCVPRARLSGGQGSAMLRSLGDAAALAVIPAGTARVAAGTVVAAIALE